MQAALADEADALAAAWAQRDDAQALAARLQPLVERALRATVQRLYPQSPLPD